ncbi:MAG TPA: Uma2 family endonuclease [Thermoanaerobaculia bacterium]|nr:Uma2 family endonuclease [Thermoanaerobaculia bacterium]
MSRHPLLDEAVHGELSLAEWFGLEEDERGELVDGHLVEEEEPSYAHEILVILLGSLLRGWFVPRGGFVGGSDAKLAVGPKQGRKPDLTVYLAGTPLPPRSGIITQPPDIAIEIVSPTPRDGRRDRVEKVGEYATFGVRYYWIIDPQLRSLEILERGPQGRYEHLLGATEGNVAIPGSDGFVLDLDAVWAEIDRFEAREAE